MKIRNGFVSNSSSSSFMCDVCGQDASGMDMCLSDAGMKECVNGHIFCEDHASNLAEMTTEDKKQYILSNYEKYPDSLDATEEDMEEIKKGNKEIIDDIYESFRDDLGDDDSYGVKEEFCPICQFCNVDSDEAYKYLLKKNNMTEKELLASLRKEFTSYADLKKYLKS